MREIHILYRVEITLYIGRMFCVKNYFLDFIFYLQGLSPTTNGSNHLHRPQPHSNQVNMHKYHSPQNSSSGQSVYFASPAVSKNGLLPPSAANIYHFSQNNSSREGQSRHHPHRQNTSVTTYL
jgi:hypothetical protein